MVVRYAVPKDFSQLGKVTLALLFFLVWPQLSLAKVWTELEPGLNLARFDTKDLESRDDGDLVVLRLDPARWQLMMHSSPEGKEARGLETEQWCRRLGLVAAINAGMYQADHRTHVGYAKVDGQVTNAGANDYLSAAAFDPIDPSEPPFRIFDLDEVPLGEVAARYKTVVQNLRLIKRPGDNRWQSSNQRWREAALGEDWRGRIMMIYCHRNLSMHDFNQILLALPLGLVAAQHLEGSGAACIWINHPDIEPADLPGGLRSGILLPNILGVAKRHPQDSSE